MNGSIFEVIVVGAGHAGLSTSYYLRHLGLEHIIFEKGRIGETWRTQRWNNFKLISPNRLNVLQGSTAKVRTPHQYSPAPLFVNTLKEYVSAFQLPVSENCTVLSIEKVPGAPVFTVKVSHDHDMVRNYDCWQVIVASGIMNQKFVPALSGKVAPSIKQIHSSEYKDAADLPPGAVLVVGGGQSGCDISRDLVDAGRQVFMSTKNTPAVPRSYRGRDVLDWMILSSQTDPNSAPTDLTADQFPVISNDPDLPILDLTYLAGKGVTLLGPLHNISDERFYFAPGINDIIVAGQHYYDSFCAKIDALIAARQIVVSEEITTTPMDTPLQQVREINELSAAANNITAIVWATGHTGTFDFVKFPVFDDDGKIIHREGVTSVDGLYFVGLPSQRTRKSGLISTIKEDASFVANKAYSALR